MPATLGRLRKSCVGAVAGLVAATVALSPVMDASALTTGSVDGTSIRSAAVDEPEAVDGFVAVSLARL
ncbi:MAG: hypothetical protein QOD72_922, partial [Acidimicrobiaceae bacterium]|nr:hypothetical protein [Acidimicrobiaceae bacterium]